MEWIQQQVVKKRTKRDYDFSRTQSTYFNDPKWPSMWYMVSSAAQGQWHPVVCSAMLGPGRQRNNEQGLFPVSGPTIGGGLLACAIFWIFFEVNSLVLRGKREILILKVFLFEILLSVVAL